MLQFHYLEAEELQRIRDGRLLRRLVDVLAGSKTIDTLDWDAANDATWVVDEAWFEISALLADDAMFGELGKLVTRDVIPIKHGKKLAYFLTPQGVLRTLVTFRQTAQLIGAQRLRKIPVELDYVEGKRTKTVRGEIVAPTSLERIRLLIEARMLTKLEDAETYLNDDRDPFNTETANATLAAFYSFIETLTAALYHEKSRRSMAVVFFSTDS